MAKLIKKIIYKGTLECKTGIHIGDSKESTDIGGLDSPVVRRKDNGQPYLPGSSIKGKMRCLLEQVHGNNGNNKFLNDESSIAKLFGATENKSENRPSLPSRLIVRDAFMEKESAEDFFALKTTDMPYTEIKWENSINRVTGTADSPRQIERVPAGAIFELEFIINIFGETAEQGEERAKEFDKLLKMGVSLLNHDYLGGSGSRGYGHVKIELEKNPESKVFSLDSVLK